MPPIEKIPEAYTAIEDERVVMYDDHATIKSSNRKKEYTIKWKDNLYYSNDNSTYWQNYPGYPVLAVLMLQNKLSLNRKISSLFKGIDWSTLNRKNKRNYRLSLESILENLPRDEREKIDEEITTVYKELANLPIELTRKNIKE